MREMEGLFIPFYVWKLNVFILFQPNRSDFYYKTSRTGVSPVLRGGILGQPGRLSKNSLGIRASKNRSIWVQDK